MNTVKAAGSPFRGVAVVIADPTTKRVLLLHRVLHWSGWEFVKGHLDQNESPAAAAERETREETGLTLSSLTPLPVPLMFQTADGDRIYDCFLGTAEEGTVTTGPEHDGFRWVGLDEAKSLLTPAHQAPLGGAVPIINQHS